MNASTKSRHSSSSSKSYTRKGRRSRWAIRPRVETLEDRSLLATFFVDDDAAGGDGSSWAGAFNNLQSALSVAASGDEIWVAGGTYKPTTTTDRAISFNLKNGVALYGGFAGTETSRSQRDWVANVVTLSGEIGGAGIADNSFNVVFASSVTNAVLDGFTVTGGNANGSSPHDRGGGVNNVNSSPTIANLIVTGNAARETGGGIQNDGGAATLTNVTVFGNTVTYEGGGICNRGSSPTLTNVAIVDNSATRGGGIANFSSSPTLTNVTISGNLATNTGGGIYNVSSSPTLTYVTLSGNSANYGGGIYLNGGTAVVNSSTLSSNHASVSGGGVFNSGGSMTITNSALTANSAGSSGGGLEIHGTTSIAASTVAANRAYESGGINNYYNYYAINISNSIVAKNSSANGYAPDIANGVISSGNNLIGNTANNWGWLATDLQNADPLFVDATGDDLHLRPGSPAIDAGTNAGAPLVDLDGRARPQDGDGNGSATTDMGAYEYPASAILYVNDDATGHNTGTSWTNAFTSLQTALSVANADDEIWVAAGTYKPTTTTDRTISFNLKSGVNIYGGFAGTETSVSERNWVANVTTLTGDIGTLGVNADNSYHVVVTPISVTNSIFDGFLVTGGNANGPLDPLDRGGGIFNNWNSAPTLANLTLSGNSATHGAGIFNEGSWATLTNLALKGNSANSGGGMYTEWGSPTLTNVVISGNSANLYGGGIVNVRSPSTMTNVTLWGNSAGIEGGGIWHYNDYLDEHASLKNGVVWGNTAGSGSPQIYDNNFLSGISVTHSIVQGGWVGTGNIDADPLFVDAGGGNLRLMADSPAIDSGTSSGAPATDVEGIARPFDGDYDGTAVVDRGAYEYHNARPKVVLNGSLGSETDAQDQTFVWDVTDSDNVTVAVSVSQDGIPIYDNPAAPISDSYDFNSLPPATYELSVTAIDEYGATTLETRSVQVVDDDTAGPTIVLDGSLGTESHMLTQAFTWDVGDPSGLGWIDGYVAVGDGSFGVKLTDINTASGSYNFDDAGLGTFWIQIHANDADSDWYGDASAVTEKRLVTVTNAPPDGLLLNGTTSAEVNENCLSGVLVGTLTSTDLDPGEAASHIFTLQNDAGGRFQIAGNQVLVAPNANLDYEQQTVHEIVVRATDTLGASTDQTFRINILDLPEYDYGDAPTSYGTLIANQGATHLAVGPRLGAARDVEDDGQPTALANGDDTDFDGDDEDGVVLPSTLIPRVGAMISVTASAAGFLDAWIDYNGNHLFDAADQIAASLPVVAGANDLSVVVPESAAAGTTYARFRLSSTGGLGPKGIAADGEVEDYRLEIVSPAQGSATIVDDPQNPGDKLLVVNGTTLTDAIVVQPVPSNPTMTQVVLPGRIIGPYAAGAYDRIEIFGNAGVDSIVVDYFITTPATIHGGDGNDSIVGGSGNDVLYGDGGVDKLSGRNGHDLLFGGNDSDYLYGGSGNDVLVGGLGGDCLYGDAGVDSFTESGAGAFVLSSTQSKIGSETNQLSGLEQATLLGDDGNNSFNVSGWSGSGVIDGNGGIDKLIATGNANFTLSDSQLTRSVGGGFSLSDVEEADLAGGAGNNLLDATGFSGQVKLSGGAGNDTLKSGAGPAILLGGTGNDALLAAMGRAVMIGGTGVDHVVGGGSDDLLIDGTTSYDSNAAALMAILNEWNSAADYATRVAHLKGTVPSGLNGIYRLTSSTVQRDTSADVLTGNDGLDWFFAKLAVPYKDNLTDRLVGEMVN